MMRTADECFAKAADMEQKAGQCDQLEARAEYLSLAQGWRFTAGQAAWQDAMQHGDRPQQT